MKRTAPIIGVAAAAAVLFFAGMAVASAGRSTPNGGAVAAIPSQAGPGKATTPPNPGLVYHRLTPCRVVDTRKAGGILIDAGRVFVAHSTNLSSQGGSSAGCGIPTWATAIAADITALSTGQNGFTRGWAAGTTPPNATLLNFSAAPISNMVDLPVSATGFVLRNYGSAHLVVDVLGYYEAQIHGVITSTGTVLSGSPAVLSATHLSTGSYSVSLDRDLTGCTVVASIDGGAFVASAVISGNFVIAGTFDTSGARKDLYWTFTVTC